MEKLVSIILPIYNVEKYLDRCMDSVTNQTYKNIEIIMVDDGSTDSCPAKCEEWARKDSRVNVIHKENEGLGEARNTGLENANGEFIFFIDSDDFVSNDLVSNCIASQMESNADIVLYGFSRVDQNGKIYSMNIPSSEKKLYSYDEIGKEILPALIASKGNTVSGLWMSAWACMYRKAKIDAIGWRFVSEREIIAEDVYSLLELYSVVENVSIVAKSLYYYCDNATSLTHVFREDRIKKINYFLSESLNRAQKYNYSELIERCICSLYCSFLIAAFKMIVNDNNMKFNVKREKLLSCLSSNECRMALEKVDFNSKRLGKSLQVLVMRCKFVDIVYLILKMKSKHV